MHLLFLTLHVIGAGILVGVVIFSLVIAFKKDFDPTRLAIFKDVRKWGTAGALLLFLTGISMYLSDPEEFNKNPLFWIKMGLVLLDGVVAVLIIDRRVKKIQLAKKAKSIEMEGLTLWGMVSLIIVVAIIYLGVGLIKHD